LRRDDLKALGNDRPFVDAVGDRVAALTERGYNWPIEQNGPCSSNRRDDPMTKTALANLYRGYIACLNRQDWPNLHRFVAADARHNGRPFGLAGYRAMLERDFAEIPDLQFNIELLVCDPPHVASRLRFDCRPKGLFLGLPVDGRRVNFAENVFYQFRDERIVEVWSAIDKGAIEAQL
jgi:predicted ester cyclase